MVKIHHNPNNEHPYSATVDVTIISNKGVVTCTVTGMGHTEPASVAHLVSIASDIYSRVLVEAGKKKQYIDMYGRKIDKK